MNTDKPNPPPDTQPVYRPFLSVVEGEAVRLAWLKERAERRKRESWPPGKPKKRRAK